MRLTPQQDRMLNAIRDAGSQGLIIDKSDQPAIRVGNALTRMGLIHRERVDTGWRYINSRS